ncbi:MAG TPA: glycosyltransferase [Labilithrix sp.]|nr:glycosyltransferase [Labilithrix sp.]
MRIALVVLSLDIGGQERLVLRMAHGLKARGHDTHVVSLSKGGALRDELGSIPVHEVVRGRLGFDMTLHARLWRRFRSLRPDVVHTHNAAPLIYAAPAARAAAVHSVVHTKHGNFSYPKRTLQLARGATRFVPHFVAVSAETAVAAIRNERPRQAALSVIENGIPLGAFHPDDAARAAVRDELGIPRDARVVGSVGRLVDDKDYPLLVRAMGPLLSERVRLVIVGEGAARPKIEAAIEPAHRPFVVLTGMRHDIPRVLSSFDLFASSSRTEGLPLAIPEAMTSSLPIVATAVGGVPGIIADGTGVLVPHADVDALRREIRRLLDDDAARKKMGETARAYALARFSEDRMLDEYLALYAR